MAASIETPHASDSPAARIDSVDTFARQLYRRARGAGTDFAEIAIVVRGLHTVLKHLKVEAEDPDSLLNSDESSVYARQLTPIVQDCEFTLKQLDTILEKYGGSGSGSEGESNAVAVAKPPLGSRERDMVGLIRNKLANEKLNIDMFLDTVQLHNPSKSHRIVDTNNANLESIKDKVDAIAAKICQRRDSSSSENEDELWLQFRNELEKEGFSKDVLRKNQDVLRAYIRQLDEQNIANGGVTPTVRGFLEGYQPAADEPLSVVPYPGYPVPADEFSPKEMYPSIDNEKFFPSMKAERLQPDKDPPYPSSLPTHSTGMSIYDQHSDIDDIDDGASDNSTALVISTRDLMAFDKRESDLAIAMGNMHLHPTAPPYPSPNYTHHPSPGTSPHQHYLPSPSNAGLLTASPSLHPVDHLGLSPRYLPSLSPPPPYGSSPPPILHSNSISAPAIPGGSPSLIGGPQSQVQRYARLAPDSQGRDIALDAKWTRIRRSLVSPEVLNQAGVRYEARPDFVAVLGVFTKEEIAEFARRSAAVRRQRGAQRRPDGRDRYYPDKYKNWDVEAQKRNAANGQSSSSSDLFDSSDENTDDELPSYRPRGHSTYGPLQDDKDEQDEKGTKIYPFIVSPPEKDGEKGPSPSSTVKPKPILKNKHDDPHVRFNPEPQVLDGANPRSAPRDRRDREKRPRDRSERDRSDRDRHVPRSYDDRDDESRRHHRSRHGGSNGEDRRRDKDRDESGRRRRRDDRDRYRGDRDRHDDERSEDRASRKKARGETLRAVGIGGAAASLLSVLTEAAAGF